MTEAARDLHVTQSAVSQALMQLERMFEVTLIDRGQRPLKVTGPGHILLNRAIPILDATENLIVAVRELSTKQVPQLRLGCVDSLLASIGPRLFRSLLDKVQRLTVTSGTTGVQSRGLLNREVDICLSSDPLDGSEGVSRLPILTEPFVLLLPTSMAQRADTPVDIGRLVERLPLVRFNPASHMGAMTDLHLRRLGLRPPRSIEVDSSEALTAMVASEIGWAITTPLCLLEVRVERRPIQVLPFPGPGFSRTLYVIARENEFAELPGAVAKAAGDALRQDCLPRLLEYAPWAERAIRIPEEEPS
jgi:DNA-binding transcriptional LysR family regulator